MDGVIEASFDKIISDETKGLIRRLLLERLSLRGICRATQVSQAWLLNFIKQEYAKTPHDLNVQNPPDSLGLVLEWLDATTRQVVAVHAGGRSEKDAKAFWSEVPEPYRSGCDVYADEWKAYKGAIPPEVHFAVKKIRKDKPHRRCELYSAAKDKSSCAEECGFLEDVCKSYRSHSVLSQPPQPLGLR